MENNIFTTLKLQLEHLNQEIALLNEAKKELEEKKRKLHAHYIELAQISDDEQDYGQQAI